jgi:DNA-binding NarL/FixJ family response regulator
MLAAVPMKPLLLVVDDHPLYRYGLTQALAADFSTIEADSVMAAKRQIDAAPQLALVLVDLRLPDSKGLDALSQLGKHAPDLPRVAISGDEDPSLPGRVQDAGASGFVHKSANPQELANALKEVLAGEVVFRPIATDGVAPKRTGLLSLRETEVLAMATRGLTNKQIARLLAITERTVKAHLGAAFRHLGAKTRTEAAFKATERGLFSPPMANSPPPSAR